MPLSSSEPDFTAILNILARHQVAFVVVGGIAATLQGVPVTTFDIDIVHSREISNVQRLLVALTELEAVFRFPAQRRLPPNASHLSSPGHNLLTTKFGPLDVLGMIGKGHDWAELTTRSDTVHLEAGLAIAVLDLPTQIAVKEEVARDKDAAMLPLLRHTLEERTKQRHSTD